MIATREEAEQALENISTAALRINALLDLSIPEIISIVDCVTTDEAELKGKLQNIPLMLETVQEINKEILKQTDKAL